MPSPTLSYYRSLVTSQYSTKPNFMAWLTVLLNLTNDINLCVASLDSAFDIDVAVGAQLDILGQIIGVSRVVPFQPSGSGAILTSNISAGHAGGVYFSGDILNVEYPGASGGKIKVLTTGPGGDIHTFSLIYPGVNYIVANNVTLTGGHGGGAQLDITATTAITSPTLDDDTYRILLKAKVAQNQWDGQLASLYAIWGELFPGGTIAVQDNQNMTATVFLSGITSSILQDLVVNGLIVPRPEGVLYNFVLSPLPAFGFDGDHTYIAGFDEGHFA